MKEKLSNLIDVKSIVTIALTILFIILAVKQVIDGREVVTIYSVIIAFYFGTQYQKTNNKLNNESEDKKNGNN